MRATVTCSPATGLNAAIQSVVQQYSFGFVTAQNASSVQQVNSGHLVKVSVSNLKIAPFAAILYTSVPIYVGAPVPPM